MKLSFLRQLVLDRSTASGYPHLSAASGLVGVARSLYVIGDDELHLAKFPIGGDGPGQLIRIFPGSLPSDPKQRKAAKPDFEVLLALPSGSAHPYGALLALGSGSTVRRQRGAIIKLNAVGEVDDVQSLDLSSLFRAISDAVDLVNVEGACLQDNCLLLFNRGNKAHPNNIVVTVDLACVFEGKPLSGLSPREVTLGSLAGVPLSITDACALEDGSIVVSAVAEDTESAYEDGKLTAAAIGLLDSDLGVVGIEMIDPAVKIEGVQAWRTGQGIQLLAVSDADDPAVAAGLFTAQMPIH